MRDSDSGLATMVPEPVKAPARRRRRHAPGEVRVWAPAAQQVEVELEGTRRRPLVREAGGWWRLEQLLPAGGRYAFVLDGGRPLPDPRSPYQPEGVHGPSCVVDHDAFPWTDAAWRPPALGEGVIYELHVGTFTPEGTFAAVIDRLDDLLELGVTHVELMPVNEFPGRRGWGYDGVDLFAPHHGYGGPEGLKRLVDACHAAGVAVILDVVYNHLGPEGNYLGQFGPYFTDTYKTPWGQAINLDEAGSDEVRRFIVDNALMWLRDYHLDGLRVDAIHAFYDRSAVPLLEQLATEVNALSSELDRRLVLIAESNLNDPKVVTPRFAGGYGCDAQWTDDLHHALHALLTGEQDGYYQDFGSLADVAKALERVFVQDGSYSVFRGRRHGRPVPRDLDGHRFLGYLQTHDQVGNRARGERLGHLIPTRRLKLAAALVLCSPRVPMLFQGEEWNAAAPFLYFTSHTDPDLAEAVREGRRHEFEAFGWKPEDVPDPQAESTFEASRLDWSERDQPEHRDVLHWYRDLLRLRRDRRDLREGRLETVRVRHDAEQGWLVLERPATSVAVNTSDVPRRVPLEPDRPHRVALGDPLGLRTQQDPLTRERWIPLPPDGVAVLV